MIRLFNFLLAFFLCSTLVGQVGIIDDQTSPYPGYMLEVRKGLHNKIRIASKHFNDSTSLIFSNRISGNPLSAGTDFIWSFIRENGLLLETRSDLLENQTADIMLIKPNGIIGLGTNSPSAAALLDLTSTTRGFLPPRMTTAQRSAITSPPSGLMVFDTETASLWFRGISSWYNLGSAGSLWQATGGSPQHIYYSAGRVGIGLGSPSYPLHVQASDALRTAYIDNQYSGASGKYGLYASASNAGTGTRYGLYGTATGSATGSSATFGIYGNATGGNSTGAVYGVSGIASSNASGTQYGVYGAIDPIATGTGARYGVFGDAYGANATAVYGINTSSAGYAGYFKGNTKVENDFTIGDDLAMFDINGYQSSLQLEMQDVSGNETIEIRTRDVNGQVGGEINLYTDNGITRTIEIDGNWSGSGKGRIVADELQIRGGADLAEMFKPAAASMPLEPGTLVSFSADGSGSILCSDTPYDKKVAGVISGANGIAPGMLMGQVGSVADGDLPLAIIGRVFVKCDAQFGSIEPGDLLTSSSTPGHAMRCTDPEKGLGSIIGKAISGLDAGRGMVLMMVFTH